MIETVWYGIMWDAESSVGKFWAKALMQSSTDTLTMESPLASTFFSLLTRLHFMFNFFIIEISDVSNIIGHSNTKQNKNKLKVLPYPLFISCGCGAYEAYLGLLFGLRS